MNELINIINKIRKIYNYDTKNLIIIIAIIIGAYLLSPMISKIIIKIGQIFTKNKYKAKESSFYKPVKLWIKILGIYIGFSMLNISVFSINILTKLLKIVTIIIIAYGFDNLIGINSKFLTKFKERNKDVSIDVIRKIFRVLIYIFAGFMITSEFGYNLTGLITGLGLGSAIIALAAQDMFKSLLAGFVLISEKPFIVGDFIEIDKYSGTVIDIKFRSTKIRATDNTVITIPNSLITNTYIINWSRLNGKRRFETNLAVDINIEPEKIESIKNKLVIKLKENGKIDSDSLQVNFSKIKIGYNNIYIYMYLKTEEYVESLQIQEKINLTILNILKEEQVNVLKTEKAIYA